MRRRALTIHGRLFLGFGAALITAATLMVAVIYIGVRYLPDYRFSLAGPADEIANQATDPVVLDPSAGQAGGFSQTRVVQSPHDVWTMVLIVSIAGVAVVAALSLSAGWVLSKRLLAPLQAVNAAAAKAAEGDLRTRINAQGPPDDLKQLADTFDTMLGRLEESFAAHRRFAANASHELLTPLATNRAILQVVMDGVDHAELAELAPMLADTNERNIAIVQALLQLTAVENATFDAEPLDVAELAAAALWERARGRERPAAATSASGAGVEAEAGITADFDAEPECLVHGNADLLRIMLLNLVDNAVNHNDARGAVQLTVRADADQHGAETIAVEVDNTGPVINQAEIGQLFEPFYRVHPRVASGRTCHGRSGHGLGLAIVKSVVAVHHGTIRATANPDGGLTVQVRLPSADSA